MAENKMGPNLQAGAGFLAKRVQKSLNRAQEKVLQKLGKTMETKDEQFELCSQNLNKQQIDGSRLFKDVRAYHSAVKAVHDTSKRLSATLKDIYEPDWNGVEDLAVITDSEDLLWNDYEEKLNDQIVRTMENYTSQFPEVKERVAKRGRKLVDYDSARHHLEAVQNAKKKDEAKIAKAEEEFNKAQKVFEEINNELREELPVLYQSRIGCYVTVFENVSNLRDVFYKEMSVLNRELYNVMKKLETQHSGKAFIIKGLNSTSGKSKKKSLVISNPIPCNTAFPADHVSIHASTQNGKDAASSTSTERPQSISDASLPEETGSGSSSKHVHSSDSDLSSSGSNTPKRQSVCDGDSSDRSTGSHSLTEAGLEAGLEAVAEAGAEAGFEAGAEAGVEAEVEVEVEAEAEAEVGAGAKVEAGAEAEAEAEAELIAEQSDDSGVDVPKSDAPIQEVSVPSDFIDSDVPQSPEQEDVVGEPAEEPKPKPVPAPRVSSRITDSRPQDPPADADDASENPDIAAFAEDSDSHNPPGFLYKAVAVESNPASEDGLLHFEAGDVIIVLSGTQEDGLVKGIQEETWNQHRDLQNHCGMFSEKLVQPVEAE